MPTYYDPVTGKPTTQAAKTYYDPTTGEPTQPSAVDVPRGTSTPATLPPEFGSDTFKAAVHAQMLGIDPGMAYEQRDEITNQFKSQGAGNYDDGELDPTIANDVKVGLESSIFGLHHREALPETVKNPGMVDKFVSGLSEMVADLPWYAAGGVVGGAAGSEVPIVGNAVGAAAGGFAVPAAMREALVLGIKDGEVKDFPDLLRRAAKVTWEGTKGAVVGAATEFTGGLAPVLAKSPLTSMAIKGMFQATGLTVAADVLEGHLPTAKDFAGNAALIVPLNLLTHGIPMLQGDTKQGMMDVYARDGKTPQESTETLNAQPPVKPDMPEGLKPAIQLSEGHIEGDTADTHDTLAERSLSSKPVTMEGLEADPALADEVLQSPKVHDQEVIDRAWQLKKESVEAGSVGGITAYHGTPTEYEGAPRTDGLGAHFTLDPELAKKFAEGRPDHVNKGRVIEAQLGISNPLRVEDHGGSHTEAAGTIQDLVKQGHLPKEEFGAEAIAERQMARQQELLEKAGVIDHDSLAGSRPTEEWKAASYESWIKVNNEELERAKEYLKKQGYDGLVYDNKAEGHGDSYVAFDQKQILLSQTEKPLRIEDLYDRNAMKSGRGFTTPDGQFLSRMEARAWMKESEPDVHEVWQQERSGDKQAELHTEDYASARNRVQARSLVEGDPVASDIPPDLKRFLAEARSTGGILNKVKAGDASAKYGYEAIRTLLVGPRNMIRAEGEQVVSRLRKLIPDPVEQQALHFVRDYRDDPEALRSSIEEIRSGDNEKLKAFIPAMERALEPMSPEMQQADAAMTDYFTKALALGRAVGTLDSAIDPSRYSPRLFARATEEGQSTGVGRPTFTDRTVNSIRREYLHTLDSLKAGDTEARTFNAIDEMSIYNDRHATAVSTALFKTELKNSALGVEGSRGKVPSGWVALTKQFEDKRTFVQDDGTSVTTVKNLYVPKDIADALKPLLEDPGQLSQLSKFLHVQSIVKGIELTLSAFHIKALTVTAFNNMGLKDFLSAMHSDSNSPDTAAIEQRGALYGLETTKTGAPFDAYRGLKPEVEATGLAKLRDNKLVKGVDSFAQGITRVTFDVVQRKWKVMDFAKKEAGWIAKNPDASPSEYATAMKGYAKEINAAYGGLNWDVMGVSRGVQNVSRMFLLAPDWTFSNVANLKYALSDGGTSGKASRAFFVKSFTTGFAMTAAASIFIGGKYDPSDVKHLDQVYLGTDKDGKEMYANWFFAGAPKDAMNLVKRSYSEGPVAGLAEVMLSKASPVAGTIVDVAKNKDYKGAPIYKSDETDLEKTGDTAKYASEKLLPITGVSAIKTVSDALTDPEHEYSYKDILEMAADAVGSPTLHQNPPAEGGGSSKRSPARGQSKRFSIRGGR